MIYTSGSTGKPKGVVVEHRNLIDYVSGLEEKIHISECKSFGLVSTLSADLGNTVIFSSLLSGGILHIFTAAMVNDTATISDYFKRHVIDCLKIVPSHWTALSSDTELLLPAKLLLFGGESLSRELVERVRSTGAACKLVNHYGPTETTIGKLLHIVDPANDHTQQIPLGQPFSDTRVYILTKKMTLCPKGVAGELCIGGAGLARGYLNQPELTSEKFIHNSFDPKDGARLYRTGDLCRWLPDGNVAFLGRQDDQVKIRGYRVEPGEVASVLEQCPQVSRAVVLVRTGENGDKRLAGYIVPNGIFDRPVISAYLRIRLPEYMIPSFLIGLTELPLTLNGKVDRKALENLAIGEQIADRYVAPRNMTEQSLTIIWQDLLEVERIGIEDNFFEAGGHSLLAIRLISAVRKQLGVELPIGDVFDYPTIAALAGRLDKRAGKAMLPVITKGQRPERIPLSFSQERLWFIDQLEGSVQYHIPSGVSRLKGNLHRHVLEAALLELVNRHEVLRTVIEQEDGRPYQHILEKNGWHLSYTDRLGPDSAALREYIGLDASPEPFDLSKDHLLRAELISLGNQEYLLVVTVHHIASDGWSNPIMVRELVEYCSALCEGLAQRNSVFST